MAPSVDVFGVQIDLRRFTLAIVVMLMFIGSGTYFDTPMSLELMALMILASFWFLAGVIEDIHDTRGYMIALGLLLTAFGGLGYLRGEHTLLTYSLLVGGPILVVAEVSGKDLRFT